MMTGTKKSITEKEQDSVNAGPISSMLMKISNASSLFVPVPGISAYASGLSWVSEISSNAAAIFGWSKPINSSTIVKTERQSVANFSHVDTVDQGQPLSMSVKNSVDVLPGFSWTDVDEMDFSFIATIPAWKSTTAWTTAQSMGTVLTEVQVSPLLAFKTRTILGGVVVNDYSPLEFCASYFNQWRGSIVYTFKIVKTEYHSGRIAVCFFPHEDFDGTPARSYLLSQYVHREIIDIRECSTFTIAVPYVSSSPYRPVYASAATTGWLSLYVVDPLTAPSSVSFTVSFILEVSGGPDMEFAIPISKASMPVYNITPQSGKMMTGLKKEPDACAIVNDNIGISQISSDHAVNAAACVGEKITSFRTLLKSMNVINYFNDPSDAAKPFLQITPFAYPIYWNGLTSPYPNTSGDLYSTLCGIYAFSRGSVRYKIFSQGSKSQDYPAFAVSTHVGTASISDHLVTSNTLVTGGTNINALRNSGPQHYAHVAANLCTEIVAPQYHRYHSRANCDHAANTNVPYIIDRPSVSSRNVITFTRPGVANSNNLVIARGGADDVNFGVFVSIGPQLPALGTGFAISTL